MTDPSATDRGETIPAPDPESASAVAHPSVASAVRRALTPYYPPVCLLAAALALFQLSRLTGYLIYRSDFASMPLSETIRAFWNGFRFDLSSAGLYLGLPVWLLLLPRSQPQMTALRRVALWAGFGCWICFFW
mgnify:FL=1